MKGIVVLGAVVVLVGCAHPTPPAEEPSAKAAPTSAPAVRAAAQPAAPVDAVKSETLAADAPQTTPGGASFTAPKGWTVRRYTDRVVLEAPEPDARIALFDLKGKKDAASAVAAAWAALRPGRTRPLKIATPRPGRDGWEEQRVFLYETSPNERLVVYAVALRRGESWTVQIVESSEPTYERRLAQVRLLHDSLRPAGYQRESFKGRKAHPLDAARIAQLREFIETSMRELDVPGVGYGFIDGGKVVYVGGAGVRAMGRPGKVDADTLFIAASNTKALTTLLLAKLVDEKKLDWDQPVVEVFPGFKLGDADTTRRVRVKHLVCACTGLPRQDLEWIFEFKGATPRSSMALLGTMQPTTGFGEIFQYSNVLAAAGGYVAAHVYRPRRELGAAYDEAMRRLVFQPLGMKRTTFDFARAQRGDYARPHSEDVEGKMRPAKMDLNYAVVPVRPAGGAWTSARDLLRYVQMELAGGKLPGGKRYISEAALLKRRERQVALGESAIYGMGLMVDTTWGIPVVHHGGDLAGYHSDMIWLPDHNVGAVILTNGESGYLMRRGLMRRLLEVLFDGRPEAAEDVRSRAAQRKAMIAKERERLTVPADPAVVAGLAKSYANKALGSLTLKRRGKTTVLDVGEFSTGFVTRKNDDGTVSLITTDPGLMGFELVVGKREGKRALIARDAQHEYAFVER